MNLKTYLEPMSVDEKQAFAQKAGTSAAYLSQLASGHRKAGMRTASAIEAASDGVVTIRDQRPDLFPRETTLNKGRAA